MWDLPRTKKPSKNLCKIPFPGQDCKTNSASLTGPRSLQGYPPSLIHCGMGRCYPYEQCHYLQASQLVPIVAGFSVSTISGLFHLVSTSFLEISFLLKWVRPFLSDWENTSISLWDTRIWHAMIRLCCVDRIVDSPKTAGRPGSGRQLPFSPRVVSHRAKGPSISSCRIRSCTCSVCHNSQYCFVTWHCKTILRWHGLEAITFGNNWRVVMEMQDTMIKEG